MKHEDELCHHGIKGMRWGIRRYQNEDGSWTPAGELRYKNYTGERLSKALSDAARSGMSKRKIVRELSRNMANGVRNAGKKAAQDGYHEVHKTILPKFNMYDYGARESVKKSTRKIIANHANDIIRIEGRKYRAEQLVEEAILRRHNWSLPYDGFF